MNGYTRLLDPQAVSLLLTSLSSNGHPNRLPSIILTDVVALTFLNDDGTFPDSLLTAMLTEEEGG
jgi:hypothetical protein